MPERSETGTLGEQIAAEFFARKGCILLERNLRLGRLEVDLVIRDGVQVAFVEVKTVRSRGFCDPIELVDRRKCQRLVRATGLYLAQHPDVPSVRIDILTVELCEGGWRVVHDPGALP